MKSLVAYYSRTNTTKKLAESIANSVNADIEEVKPKVNYQGKIGFARGGKDALQAKIVDLEDLDGALKQLEEATTKPQKTLSLTTKEVKKDLFEDKLNSFVE